jgi:hypothetical protein
MSYIPERREENRQQNKIVAFFGEEYQEGTYKAA